MKIQVLYFERCPNHEPTVERIRRVVQRLGIDAPVTEVEVSPNDDPAALKFLGSPTVLINGQDIDPTCRQNVSYGFSCRTYAGQGMPSESLIEQAIHEAIDGDGSSQSCCSKSTLPSSASAESTAFATMDRSSLYSGLGAAGMAIVSSACCWLPLLLLAFGLSAGGVAGFFESVRPYFLAAAVVFLGAGFYFAYFRGFRKSACKPGDACAAPNLKLQRFNRAMLWVATVFVIVFALFPYYSPALVRAFAGSNDARAAVITAVDAPGADGPFNTKAYRITGMTCRACATELEVQLNKLPGVVGARVSYADGTATIRSKPANSTQGAVIDTIQGDGFGAVPALGDAGPKVSSNTANRGHAPTGRASCCY